jgi:hypothetical protein
LDKLRDGINLELNALPTDKKNLLKKVIYDYLEYIVRDLQIKVKPENE